MGLTLTLIFLSILMLPFYTFFVHRFYIYFISINKNKLILEYNHWFSSRRAEMNLDHTIISIKNMYKISFETLEIRGNNIKITQSIQGDWKKELIQESYNKLIEQQA